MENLALANPPKWCLLNLFDEKHKALFVGNKKVEPTFE